MMAVDLIPEELSVPPGLEAMEPAEARGLERDEVRLLVAGVGPVRHGLFRDLGFFLEPGDLLVVNTSATIPAAVDGARTDGTAVKVHFAQQPKDRWIVELRRTGHGGVRDAWVGEYLELAAGAGLVLDAAVPNPAQQRGSRLWTATFCPEVDIPRYLASVGRPIAYDYVRGQWPLAAYQTIFAKHAGSAEMPSAGRPFSARLVADLVSAGVRLAPVVLHTGLSSLEAFEEPLAERYAVPATTAQLVNATRAAGHRIIAVGTTVTRALESAVDAHGAVVAAAGWTDLVLRPQRPARVVDGLITGWHDADASHLSLLRAVAGTELAARAYHAAATERYRWHEFGDSCLLLGS